MIRHPITPKTGAVALHGVRLASSGVRCRPGSDMPYRRAPAGTPVCRSRLLRDMLGREGHTVGLKHVAHSWSAWAAKRSTASPPLSKRHPAHVVSPYQLRNLNIIRSHHVWVAEMSAPCRRGWRKTNHAGWLPTGSWHAARSGRTPSGRGLQCSAMY